MLVLEKYPTNSPEICVGVAPEHILPAKSVFRVITNSEVCHINGNPEKTKKISRFGNDLKNIVDISMIILRWVGKVDIFEGFFFHSSIKHV